MPKHLPGTIWFTRTAENAPYQTVRTDGERDLQIVFFPGDGDDGLALTISRRDARLLAKRIRQCLDETK